MAARFLFFSEVESKKSAQEKIREKHGIGLKILDIVTEPNGPSRWLSEQS